MISLFGWPVKKATTQVRDLEPGAIVLHGDKAKTIKSIKWGDGFIGGHGFKTARIVEIAFVNDDQVFLAHPRQYMPRLTV